MNMQMIEGERQWERKERGVLLLLGSKQKARVIFIIQLRNITATMLGLQPFRVVLGSCIHVTLCCAFGEAFEVIVFYISPDGVFVFTRWYTV